MERLSVKGWTGERRGAGEDTLLLVPDLLGGPEDFAPLAEWLAQRAQVLVAQPPADPDLLATLGGLNQLLAEVGTASAVALGIGHGGLLVQAWRKQNWSRTRGLVLLDSHPMRAARAWRFEVGSLALRSMPAGAWRSWVRQRSAYRHGPTPPPPALSAATEAFEARLAAPDARARVLASLARTTAAHQLEQRSAWDGPVLVVEEKGEPFERPVQDWRADFPARQLVKVEGRASLAPLLEVETLATRVLAMLSTLPPGK
ncbi:MAG: hypothetical protein H6741_16295 [Alphaproteobacteria bacterium]|nr:hypothetical protein [Alphaproteobacteria bacterium]MCB9794275.1 hypothetical protein [Alphaproteobacteria bacterium]